MGQKIHPIGFRVGITKPHNANWFASYKSYSNLLEEDYKIRSFCKKRFNLPRFYKEGFVKLKIDRKGCTIRRKEIYQLKLKIYTINPRLLLLKLERRNLIETLVQTFPLNYKKIRLQIFKTARQYETVPIAKYMARQIKNRVPFRRVFREVTKKLQQRRINPIKGFKLQISGRLNGAEMARTEWIRRGRVPLQTLRARIKYTMVHVRTKYGIFGIKVWICIQ